MAMKLDNWLVFSVGVGAMSVATMVLGQTYAEASLTRFWLTVVGFSVLTGCLLYGLARFALWCEHDTQRVAEDRPTPIDITRYRCDEIRQALQARDQRKDGAA